MEGEVKAEIVFTWQVGTSQALRLNIVPETRGNAFREETFQNLEGLPFTYRTSLVGFLGNYSDPLF